jgi:hypothetical protein
MFVVEGIRRVCVVFWIAGYIAGLGAADSTPGGTKPGDEDPDFTGKVLLISLKGPPEITTAMEKAVVKRLGKRTFLVGQSIDPRAEKNPRPGLTLWIAVDEVTRMWEFKDIAEAQKYYRSVQALSATSGTIELESDVVELKTRSFAFPVNIAPGQKESVVKPRLYVSQDRGKNWILDGEYPASKETIPFVAPQDGLFWFALQTVAKDGSSDPASGKELKAALKVYVNSAGKSVSKK